MDEMLREDVHRAVEDTVQRFERLTRASQELFHRLQPFSRLGTPTAAARPTPALVGLPGSAARLYQQQAPRAIPPVVQYPAHLRQPRQQDPGKPPIVGAAFQTPLPGPLPVPYPPASQPRQASPGGWQQSQARLGQADDEATRRASTLLGQTLGGLSQSARLTGEVIESLGTRFGQQFRLMVFQLRQINPQMRQMAFGAMQFTRAFLPIPGTLSGLIAQSVQAGAPTAMSTLNKSFQLVIGQLATAFIPVIGLVITKLQQLATGLEDGKGVGGVLKKGGQGLGAILDYSTSSIKRFVTAINPVAFLLGNGPKEFEKWGKEKEDPMKALEGQRQDAFRKRQLAADEMRRGLHGETLRKWFGGEDERSKHLNQQDRGDWDLIPDDIKKELKGKELLKPFLDYENVLREKLGTDAEEVRREGLPGKKGGSGALADLPPGYQAKQQGLADIRSQFQMGALGTSPLDMKLLQLGRKNHEELIKKLDELKPKDGLPAKKPLVTF